MDINYKLLHGYCTLTQPILEALKKAKMSHSNEMNYRDYPDKQWNVIGFYSNSDYNILTGTIKGWTHTPLTEKFVLEILSGCNSEEYQIY